MPDAQQLRRRRKFGSLAGVLAASAAGLGPADSAALHLNTTTAGPSDPRSAVRRPIPYPTMDAADVSRAVATCYGTRLITVITPDPGPSRTCTSTGPCTTTGAHRGLSYGAVTVDFRGLSEKESLR
jgi:hypothetical protein